MTASAASNAGPLRFDARHPVLVVLAGLVFGSLVVGAAAGQGLLPGVVALIAVGATLWAVSHPVTGTIAIVALVPATSGIKRGLPLPGLRLSELLAVGFGVMLLATVRGGAWSRWRPFDWLALGYVVGTFALGLAASELRGDSLDVNDVGQLIGPLQFFLLYRAAVVALPERRDRLRALDWLLLASIPVALITLLQTIRFPGVHELLVTYTGMDYSDRETWAAFRANGPFAHHTTLAAYLLAIVVIGAALLLAGVRGRRRRVVIAALVPATVALLLSLTFAPMLAAPAGVLALAWWYRRTGRVLAVAAVVGLLLATALQPLLAGRVDEQFKTPSSSTGDYSLVPSTVTHRLSIWSDQYLPVLEGRWLTGYGPQIPPEITWQYTESIYLTLLLRGGLPLLALYAALMVAMALIAVDVGRRRARDEDDEVERALARALVVLIGLLAVIQTIAPLFTANGLPQVWWIAAALVVGAAYRPELPIARPRRRRRSLVGARGAHVEAAAAPERRPRLGSLWSEAGVVLSGNILARGLGFLFPIVLAHAVSKHDFGTVYFFIGTGYFVGELVLAGFPTAMTRFIAAEGTRAAWLSSAIAGGIPLLAVSLAAGETLAVVADAPRGLMWMVVCGLTLDAYYFGLLRGLRRFKLLAGYRVSANLTQLLLLVGAIAAGIDMTWVVVAIYSFVYAIPILAIEALRRPLRHALRGTLRPDRARVRQLARFAVPALISGTAYAGLIQADVLFVKLLAPDALGDYAAARSLAQPVLLVPYAIAIVMLPAVASADEARRWRMLSRALGVTALLGALLVGVYLAGAGPIVELVLPADYNQAADMLPLLAAGLAVMGMYSILSQWWMGIGRPIPPALALTFGAMVAIGLQYALTPAHGGVGAATAIAIGIACALLALGVATLRARRAPRVAVAAS